MFLIMDMQKYESVDSLEAKTLDFHAGGPGSIPGEGILSFFDFFPNFKGKFLFSANYSDLQTLLITF